MAYEPPDGGPPKWVISQSQKIVSGRTLIAVKAALRAADQRAVTEAREVRIALADLPALNEVGGIARVPGPGTPVAIARVGRTSYLAYRLSNDVLEELELDLDETGSTVTVRSTLAV